MKEQKQLPKVRDQFSAKAAIDNIGSGLLYGIAGGVCLGGVAAAAGSNGVIFSIAFALAALVCLSRAARLTRTGIEVLSQGPEREQVSSLPSFVP